MKLNRNTKKSKRSKIKKNKTHKKKNYMKGGLGVDSILKGVSKLAPIAKNGLSKLGLPGMDGSSNSEQEIIEKEMNPQTLEEKIKKKTEEVMCNKLKEIMNDNKNRLTNIINEKIEQSLETKEFTVRLDDIVVAKLSDVLSDKNGNIYIKLANVIEKSFDNVVRESILKALEKQKQNI